MPPNCNANASVAGATEVSFRNTTVKLRNSTTIPAAQAKVRPFAEASPGANTDVAPLETAYRVAPSATRAAALVANPTAFVAIPAPRLYNAPVTREK
jgi:hypothetical protein